MTHVLQVLVSLLFFGNKAFVLVGRKKIGWLLGVIAASLGVIYFYSLSLYVYSVLDIGLIVLMGYGYFQKEGVANDRVELILRIVTGTVMAVLACVTFNGAITAVEFSSSMGMLLGTYFLTHDRKKLGWVLYGLAHVAGACMGYMKDQQFFADFQIASAIISIVGLVITEDRSQ